MRPIDPESLILTCPAEGEMLDWAAVFGVAPADGVAIEIGTGNGVFLAEEAARRPELAFLGIEQVREFHTKTTRRCAREGLTNVRTMATDALDLLEVHVVPESVEVIYSNFSDPWPKRRHARRRVFGAHSIPIFEGVLVAGGEVRFRTDVGYYFNLALTALRMRAGWRIVEVGRLAEPTEENPRVVTNFERKAREVGRSIWGFTAAWEPES